MTEAVADGVPRRRSWVVNALGIATVVGFCAIVLTFCLAQRLFGSDPWPAKVLSASSRQVCVRALSADEDPMWSRRGDGRFCLSAPLQTWDGDPIEVEKGDCVDIEEHHPLSYVKRLIPCPPTRG